jgi:hypothetical protein
MFSWTEDRNILDASCINAGMKREGVEEGGGRKQID